MKKLHYLIIISIIFSSCNKARNGYEKKGMGLSFEFVYNQNINTTTSLINLCEYGVWYSGYSEYPGAQGPDVNSHNVKINGIQFSNVASEYQIIDTGLINQVTYIYRDNNGPYINTFSMVDSISFQSIDTLHILTDDSLFYNSSLNQGEEIILEIDSSNLIIGKTSVLGVNGVKVDSSILNDFMNQIVTFRLTRVKKFDNYDLSLPVNQGSASVKSFRLMKVFITN